MVVEFFDKYLKYLEERVLAKDLSEDAKKDMYEFETDLKYISKKNSGEMIFSLMKSTSCLLLVSAYLYGKIFMCK